MPDRIIIDDIYSAAVGTAQDIACFAFGNIEYIRILDAFLPGLSGYNLIIFYDIDAACAGHKYASVRTLIYMSDSV